MSRKPGKGKLKLDAAVTQVMKFEACFRGIIAQAHRESWTHAKILEERTKRIFEHPNWVRLPGWGQQAVLRFSSGALAVLDCTCVHWQLYLDGERVKSADVPKGEWARVKGCSEWTHSGEPFTQPEGVIDADR